MGAIGGVWTFITGPLPALGQVTVGAAKAVAEWHLPDLSGVWSLASPLLTLVGIILILLVLVQGPLARAIERRRERSSGIQITAVGHVGSPPEPAAVPRSIAAVDDLTTPVASLDPRIVRSAVATGQAVQPNDHDAEHEAAIQALKTSLRALRGLALPPNEERPSSADARMVAEGARAAIKQADEHDSAWHEHVPSPGPAPVLYALRTMGYMPSPKSDWGLFIENAPARLPKWRRQLVWRVAFLLKQLGQSPDD